MTVKQSKATWIYKQQRSHLPAEPKIDIKYKNLPALHDSIRDAQGVDAAQTFNSTVSASLDGLTTSLEQAKGDVNNAVATLTGQEVSTGANDLDLDALGGDEDELDLGMDDFDAEDDSGGDEGDFDLGLEPDEEEVDLGRGRR